jgi:D-alanyl-D-alanine carboxypeptidase
MRDRWLAAAAAVLTLCAAACGGGNGAPDRSGAAGRLATTTTEPTTAAPTTAPPTTAPDPFARPSWLGTRVLPLRADGTAGPEPTPPELDPRQLATIDLLPPPADGGFHSTVGPVPPDVAARSTWRAACPVTLDQLSYVTVSFWGFDGRVHTGELMVDATQAERFVGAFQALFDARYPIEEMRITTPADLDAPPTGDGNNTSAFACRPIAGRGRSSWSSHAYGRAVDINPFMNPYISGDLVLPELATSYLDRTNVRPGMLADGDGVVTSFGNIGWTWGGLWTRPTDYMHFSADDR